MITDAPGVHDFKVGAGNRRSDDSELDTSLAIVNFLKVKVEDLASYCNDHNSLYMLADKTIVLKHMDEVRKVLETWDIVMLAGGMKIDGAGYGNKIVAQDGSSLGHALIVKVPAAAAVLFLAALAADVHFAIIA